MDYGYYRSTKQNGRCGLISKDGTTILRPKYLKVDGLANNPNFVKAKDVRDRYYLFTAAGERLFRSQTIEPLDVDPSGRFVKARNHDGLLGIVGTTGEWLIEPTWTDIKIHETEGAKGFVYYRAPRDENSEATYHFTNAELLGEEKAWKAVLVFNRRISRYEVVTDRIPSALAYRPHISAQEKVSDEWTVVDRGGKQVLPLKGKENSNWLYGYYDEDTGTVAAQFIISGYWGGDGGEK